MDLIGTASAPQGLFEAINDEGDATYVEVPSDDYRSIRRAILDVDEFSNVAQSKR